MMIPSGWTGCAIIAGSIALAGGVGGYTVRGTLDAPVIAKAQSRYDALYAQTQAAVATEERMRADANVKAAQDSEHQSQVIARLQDALSRAAAERNAISKQLSEQLSHAASIDTNPLGPAVLHYLDGVRGQQAAGGTTP